MLLSATFVHHLWRVNWQAPELRLSWLERQTLLCLMPGVPGATGCRLLFDKFASRVVCSSSPRSLADHVYKGDLNLPSDQKTLMACVYARTVCCTRTCAHAESVRLDMDGRKGAVCHTTHTTCRVGVSKNRCGNVGVSKKGFRMFKKP